MKIASLAEKNNNNNNLTFIGVTNIYKKKQIKNIIDETISKVIDVGASMGGSRWRDNHVRSSSTLAMQLQAHSPCFPTHFSSQKRLETILSLVVGTVFFFLQIKHTKLS